MILCSAELRIISCLPTHVINLVINDNSLEILYLLNDALYLTQLDCFSSLANTKITVDIIFTGK